MRASLNFKYYLITNREVCAPRPLPEVIKEACKAGIQAIQLREKDLNDRRLFKLAQQIREITDRHKAQLFINDRADIAMAVGAGGVHCREESLSPETIGTLDSDLTTGASVHSLERAQQACEEGADFLLFGPVFYTPSKASYGRPHGVEKLRKVAKAVSRPVFAVGGITPKRAQKCMDAGVAGIAGISSIMESSSIKATVKSWESKLGTL